MSKCSCRSRSDSEEWGHCEQDWDVPSGSIGRTARHPFPCRGSYCHCRLGHTGWLQVSTLAALPSALADAGSIRIHIEERPSIEAQCLRGAVVPIDENNPTQATIMYTPQGIPPEGVYNPSFDVTPAELITAIVTERGVATRRDGAKEFDLSHFG